MDGNDSILLTESRARAVRKALEVMGLALADHHHQWTDEERSIWDRAFRAVHGEPAGTELPATRKLQLVLEHPGGFAPEGGIDYLSCTAFRLIDVESGDEIADVVRVEQDLGRGQPNELRVTLRNVPTDIRRAGFDRTRQHAVESRSNHWQIKTKEKLTPYEGMS